MHFLCPRSLLLALVALPACSSGSGGTSEPGSQPASQLATLERPEPDENGVRVRGGETGDFGSDDVPVCIHTRQPVSIEQARALGLPIDAQLASFDRPLTASLHYGPPSCVAGQEPSSDTSITLVLRPLQVYAVDVEPNPSVVSDDDCGADYLAYDAVVEVSTADGALAGTFYAPVSAFEGPLGFVVRADVRNFEGSLELPVDPERVHFAIIDIAATIDGTTLDGSFVPEITYVDVTPWQPTRGVFAFFPARSGADDPFCDASSGHEEPSVGPESFALDAYPGSNPPATFAARLEVRAFDGARANVEVLVDGAPRQLADVSEEGQLELGGLEAGAEVAVSVRNAGSSGSVSAVVFSNDCLVAAAGCSGDCSANDEGVVVPLDCRGVLD
ncbi:MAG TPA: hypothetical protein VMG12_36050 [Polyangiaceae bacterium]|nr:hypothetical protein [Polyangiaceae bacterium]